MQEPEPRLSGCPCCGAMARREFLKEAAAVSAGLPLAAAVVGQTLAAAEAAPRPAPIEKKPAVVKVAFLRHPAPYSGGWPGHGFNNDVACKTYSEKLSAMGRELGMTIDLADAHVPFTDEAAIDRFIAAVKAQKPDALLLCPMGIYAPWDKANKVLAATKLPALVFTQIGTSFTMNTTPLASRPGIYLVSSLDVADVRPGLEMVKAQKLLSQSRLLVLKGGKVHEQTYGKVGTRLYYIPETIYVDVYQKTAASDEVRRLAKEAISRAKQVREVSHDDVVQATRHYFASRKLMAQYGADGITSNCLGMLFGRTGTPCLGYAMLMDEGIPAGCEADVGSAVTMLLSHHLLGRPGFMADPVVDTAQNLFANAHCNCPTKLDGFSGPRETHVLRAHHGGGHWVSLQVLWRIGQVFTLTRFQKPGMLIVDRAKVVCNYESPPSAACITNVGSIVEGAEDNPHKVGGFHVLQVYGDHVKKLKAYCQLYGVEAIHAWDPRASFQFEPDMA